MSATSPPPQAKQPIKITMPSKLPPQQPSKAWYDYITVDLLIHVASRSIFHPAIVLIFWLCLASVPPLHHRHPLANPTLYYATFLMFVRLLMLLNERITYGVPRKVNWEDEVVVITGGGMGLGRCIAEMLLISKRGVKVAVIDVKEPDEVARAWMKTGGEFEGRLWWGCIDVRNSAAVKIMAGRIKEELGMPSVLINNAAAPVHGLPLVSMTEYESGMTTQLAARTIEVNVIGHFNTLGAFLGDLMRRESGATVVTVGSLLAHLAPARLSDYGASKSAVASLHHALGHEMGANADEKIRGRVKTVLVEPGEIMTGLFEDITVVPWYARFLAPILEVNEVAKEIVRVLDTGSSGVIRMPFYCKCMPLYSVLPGSFQRYMRWFSGIDQAIVPKGSKTKK